MQVPVPSFLQTRSLLLLRETQLAHTFQPSPQVALYGNATGSGSSAGGEQGGARNFGGGSGNGRFQRKKKNGNSGDRGGSSTGDSRSNPSASLGPWICFNPYTGQAQQMQPTWRPAGGSALSGAPGLLGPRPTGSPSHRPSTWVPPGQQAFTTQLAPLHGQAFSTAPPPPGTTYGTPYSYNVHAPNVPAWDCSALVAALNSTAGSFNGSNWTMDSGATSHMVSDPGILSPPIQTSSPSHVTVGNGSTLPILSTSHTTISTPHHHFLLTMS
jgi:hypothetical protein